ncbi:hypothetical protein C8R44DRAFT_891266 [Mycena epipterygia]|nr:hypothetical protein C8R44DRAFT_891266 [Mycena epipterygia]
MRPSPVLFVPLALAQYQMNFRVQDVILLGILLFHPHLSLPAFFPLSFTLRPRVPASPHSSDESTNFCLKFETSTIRHCCQGAPARFTARHRRPAITISVIPIIISVITSAQRDVD